MHRPTGGHATLPTTQASLAAGIVDAVLIPEVPFVLEGEHGLLAYLQRIMEEKGGWAHCWCVERGGGEGWVHTVLECVGEEEKSGWVHTQCWSVWVGVCTAGRGGNA